MTTSAWDHERFYKNVIARAKALGVADSTAALSRATGIGHGMLSKWYRGHERPSPKSLQKLSDILTLPEERAHGKTAYTEFMVLAGHLEPHQVGLAEPPAPPQVVAPDPDIAELMRNLSDTSTLTAAEKADLRAQLRLINSMARKSRNGGKRSA